jgi:hypothetical protein
MPPIAARPSNYSNSGPTKNLSRGFFEEFLTVGTLISGYDPTLRES